MNALRDETPWLRAAVESLDDAVLMVDRDGRILRTNPSAELLAGMSLANAQGLPIAEVLPVDPPDAIQPVLQAVVTGQPLRMRGPTCVRPNCGDAKWVSISASPAQDDSGTVIGAVLVLRKAEQPSEVDESSIRSLRTSEERFRAIAESTANWEIWLGPDGKLQWGNTQVERLTGYSATECHAMPGFLMSIVSPDDAARVADAYHGALAGTVGDDLEFRIVRKDGEVRWCSASWRPMYDSTGRPLGCRASVSDISVRKRGQEARRRVEERFSLLYAGMSEGVAVHRLVYAPDGRPIDYVILDTNTAYEGHTGLSRSDVIGKRASEVYGTEGPPFLERYARVAESGEPQSFEVYFPPLGKHFRISAYCPEPGHFSTVFDDITVRTKAETALRDRETELAAVYGNAPVVLLLLDSDRRVRKSNTASAELTGVADAVDLAGLRVGDALRCVHTLRSPDGCGAGPQCQTCTIRQTVIDTLETGNSHLHIEAALQAGLDGRKGPTTVLLSTKRLEIGGEPLVLASILDISDRKAAERQVLLQASVLDQIQDFVTIMDLDGSITYVNDSQAAAMQRTRAGLIGTNVRLYGGDTSRGATQCESLERTLADGSWRGDVVYVAEDGTELLMDIRTTLVRDLASAPVAICGIATDVTHTRLSAAELRASEEKFSKAFHSSPAIMVITRMGDGRILDVNEAFERATGYAREEAIGKRIADDLGVWVDADERERANEYLRNGKGLRSVDRSFRDRFGRPFHVILSAQVIDVSGEMCVLATAVDITDRKRAEGALQASEDRYRRLFEGAAEGVVTADAQSGTILDCNQAFLALSGYERDEIVGKPQTILHPPETGSPTVTSTFALHCGPMRGHAMNSHLVTKFGDVKDVVIRANVIEAGDSSVLQGLFVDVTEERRRQREHEITLDLLRLLNDRNHTHALIAAVTDLLHEWTGCEAVGVRLQDGDDYPYFESRGFPAEFIRIESSLCARRADGTIMLDTTGSPVLDCMCGNVLRGRFDPRLPYFTAKGSFWSNCTTELLASTTEAERQARTRNRCNSEGFESVALVALRHGGTTLGLLQLNDHHRDRFTVEMIEFIEHLADQIAVALAQRQAQAALADSEQRLQLAVQAGQVGVWDWDLVTGGIVWYGEHERLFGLATGAFGGAYEDFERGVHPDDREGVRQHVARAIDQGVDYDHEFRVVWPDGSVRWVHGHGRAVYDASGNVVRMLGVLTDTTERTELAEARRRSELRLRLALNAGKAVAWSLDPDLERVDFSGNLQWLFGASSGSLSMPYKEFEQRIVPDGRDGVRATLMLAASHSRICRGEFQALQLDGTPFWVSAHGEVERDSEGAAVRIIGILIDTTERRATEDSLRLSEERLRLSQRAAHIGCFHHNLVTGAFWQSDEATKLLGIEHAPSSSAELRPYVHPDDLPLWDAAVHDAVSGSGDLDFEHRAIRADGTVRNFHIRGAVGRDANGNPTEITGTVQDVTDRAMLEAQLRQAQKMESVGRLAGGVAHDFNNMLQIILGNAEIALDTEGLNDRLAAQLRDIEQAAERSATLTKRLLAFARKQPARLEVVDLNELVANMQRMLERLIGEHISLRLAPGTDLWKSHIDPAQVDQVLANLMVNARDAIDDAGAITIETGNVVLDESYCSRHLGARSGDYVMLAVSDTGCGMGADTQAHMFEPFFTTKERDKGTGLGLAMVYGIVKQNNGYVDVFSEVGRGTTLRIYLPRHGSSANSQCVRESSSVGIVGTETVMLAEDEEGILHLATSVLERHGYTVLAAQTPEDIIAIARDHAGPIHALVTDVVLPRMNGRALRDRVAQDRPGIKCLFMSGYTADVIARSGVLEEGVDLLQKPFSIDGLLRKVREVLDA